MNGRGYTEGGNALGSYWTKEQDDKLRVLWDAGLSTTEIGRRLGKSKNSVISRARRSGCTKRENPIKRGVGEPKRKLRAVQKSVKALPSLATIQAPPPVRAVVRRVVEKPASPARKPTPAASKPKRTTPCAWPMNDRWPWRFCDVPTCDGPYCEEHAQRAYARTRRAGDAEEDQAA